MDIDAIGPAATWLRQNASSPDDYLVGLYKSHQVVIFGEQHNVREHKTFIGNVLGRLYNEAGVQCLAWEFSCPEDDARLDRLVTAKEFDEAAALAFARDQYVEWNSADHWDLIRAVWRVNQARTTGKPPLRMVGLRSRRIIDAMYEWESLKPGSRRFWELLEMMMRQDDAGMASEVVRQVIEPGIKGLAFVGLSHDMTKYTFPNGAPAWFTNKFGEIPEWVCPPDKPFRTIMGRLLYQKYGDRVFQVSPHGGVFPEVEDAMTKADLKSAGFTVEGSPLEEIKSGPGFGDAPGVPMKLLAQGFVYLGPGRELHANRVIEGFVTESMFQRYRKYYEKDFGQSFENAQEVDEYLQKHRWPWRTQ
jgi:hypothetical protein